MHRAMNNPIVVIPARLAATRLPNKPLAPVAGAPMIVQVWRRAVEADVGPVVVAAGDAEIVHAIEAVGGQAVATDPALPSGSDRVMAALAALDPARRHDAVVNLQGDLPTIYPGALRAALGTLADPEVDIGTLVVEITDPAEIDDPNVVKAVLEIAPGDRSGRALSFTRASAPWGAGPRFHHVGIYAYRRAALEAFVGWPAGVLERRERLEQLRALSRGLRIDAAVVDAAPIGVDTADDLARADALLRARGGRESADG